MPPNRLGLRLVLPAALVLLVATLATLQYRWLGQVSEAERARLHASLAQRAAEFADDFDREILRLYLALQVEAGPIERGDTAAFARSYDQWREASRFPEMLSAVYLADGSAPGRAPRRYDPVSHTFVAAAWPDALKPVTDRLADVRVPRLFSQGVAAGPTPLPRPPDVKEGAPASSAAAAIEQLRHLVTVRDPIVASVPALIVSLPSVASATPAADTQTMSVTVGTAVLVAALDGEYLTRTVLPTLAERYFPERDADAYRFAVVAVTGGPHPVYARGLADGASLDARTADATVPLFSLRPDLAPQVAGRIWVAQSGVRTYAVPLGSPARSSEPDVIRLSPVGRSLSFVVESRAAAGAALVKAGSDSTAAWQLRLQHTAGSLDAAVNLARRRNLWLSFGILTVLAAGVLLIVVNAQRSQRLAVQQMEFVATVTHELRTPLTVIRSAAQNLSAGVVHDATQAQQYGDLIETEGRRLTDMVEQVLEFAGLSGSRRAQTSRLIDLPDLIRDVVTSVSAMPDASHIDIAVDVPEDLPPLAGDRAALRRALQNLIGNAVKYGGDGRWVGVSARRTLARGGDEVQIVVSDRGRGIDPDDLPHIFEPFYRGRYAIEHQIHGNGLGLSLVRRIAEAHGGRVSVTSTPESGTTFTITLPAPLRRERTRRGWAPPDPDADPIHPGADSHPATD